MSAVTPTTEEIIYPSSDGEPMAETPIHIRAIILLFEALEDYLRDRPEDYIAADMFWYWEEGNPSARRAPDVMYIPGVGRKDRKSFFSWRENGAVPAVIFEVSSEKTWREDLYEKRRLYAELGVTEYFLFDPEALYLRPQLQGFRLHGDLYVPLEADSEDRLRSEELGLFLRVDEQMIRLINAETGEPILTREEQIKKAEEEVREANRRAEEERHRAEGLEAEVERLRALLQQEQSTKETGRESSSH